MAINSLWCASGFGTVLEVFVVDIYGWWVLKKKVIVDLLCNPIVTTNNVKPFIVIAKQLVFRTRHAQQ